MQQLQTQQLGTSASCIRKPISTFNEVTSPMKFFIYSLCLAFPVFSTTLTASASIVVWGSAQNTLAPTDISTNGTLVRAFNGGTLDATVNGVLFQQLNQVLGELNFAAGSFLGGGTTGDAEFNKLLDQTLFSFNMGNTSTIDLGSFVASRSYEIQIFFTDQRTNANQINPSINDRITTYGSTDGVTTGPTVDLEADPDNMINSVFGQFAIGTFTADGNDPDLTLLGSNYPATQINAWQIRDVAVIPELGATTLLTMLLGIGGASLKRRRLSRS